MVDGAVRSLLMTADAVGGVWTYAVDLSRALAARGVAVTLAVIGRTSQAQRRAAALVVAPTYAMLRDLDRFYGPLPGARAIWNARDHRLFEPRPKEPIVLA